MKPPGHSELTHLPLVHIYASVNWRSTGSGNGLLPVRHQAITWTSADLFSIGPLGANFSEIWNLVFIFKIYLKYFSFVSYHESYGKDYNTDWGNKYFVSSAAIISCKDSIVVADVMALCKC